jgi:hypothetical protein
MASPVLQILVSGAIGTPDRILFALSNEFESSKYLGKNEILSKLVLPVGLISLLFDIQKSKVMHQARVHFVSMVTYSSSKVYGDVRVVT